MESSGKLRGTKHRTFVRHRAEEKSSARLRLDISGKAAWRLERMTSGMR